MDSNTTHRKAIKNDERFSWENEEEASAVEIESMSYSTISLAASMIVVVVTTIILMC